MKTVRYIGAGGIEKTYTEVSKVDFKTTKKGHIMVHSAVDGAHELAIENVISID